MGKLIASGMVLISALSLQAQTINIKGKVTNSGGQAVDKAVVELVKRGLKDTTGPDGMFALTGTVGLKRPTPSQGIAFDRGVLRLAVAQPAPLRVEIFDAQGNQLRMEAMAMASQGEYRWDLSARPLSSRMMLIKATVGSETRSFRYLPAQGDEAGGELQAAGFTPAVAFLQKAAADVDTLRVTATGYAVKKAPVAAWDATVNVALDPPAAGGRSAGCGKTPTLKSGKGLSFTPPSGGARTYNLRVPDDYDNNTAYRLIVGIHWMNGTANNVSDGNYYGLWPLANPSGSKSTTIFIAPQGIDNRWPSGNVPFISSLVNKIKEEFCIDESRVFAEGFSMGGSMSYALACEVPEMFRGVAVHSGGGMSGCNKKNKPVAYFMTHGTKDGVCTYPGYGVPQINDFAKINGCQAMDIPNTLKPTDASGMNPACADFQGCQAAYPTRACIFVGDHVYNPGGNRSWVPGETWKFISQF